MTAHIQLSATIQSVCTTKDASSFGANSSSEEKRVACTMLCRKLGVIPPRMMNENDDDEDEDNIFSQNWHRTVGMKVVAMYH